MPNEHEPPLREGDMVQITFAETTRVGIVVEIHEEANQVVVLGPSWKVTVDAESAKKL